MKQKISYILLVCSAIVLSSFHLKSENKSEDDTAYVFAYIAVKNPTLSKPASVFCRVFAVTVEKGNSGDHAKFATWALESKLRKYIEGEMGKELISPTLTCCFEYSYSRNEADERRLEMMSKERDKGHEILHAGPSFGFSWDWKKDMGN